MCVRVLQRLCDVCARVLPRLQLSCDVCVCRYCSYFPEARAESEDTELHR